MNIEFVVKILDLFTSNPDLDLTILEISKKSGLSYNAAHRTIQSLLKKQILNLRKVGKASLISLNKTRATISFLTLANYQKSVNPIDKEEFLQKFSEIKNTLK